MRISIVIPVYNVERFLRKCLDSVCAQADCVKEIILVDDGSTDGSLNICNEYAQKDERIKIISQTNCGTEAAVIAGVNATTCEYVGFVDSDDYIEPTMFSKLSDLIERTGADIAFCRYDLVDEDYNFVCNRNLGIQDGVYEKVDGRFPIMLLPRLGKNKFIAMTRWNKLIPRELIVNNVAFKKADLRVGEDIAMIFPVVMSAKKLACTEEYLYHYVIHDGSIMRSYSERNLPDWEKTVKILQNACDVYEYKFDNFSDTALALLLTNCIVPLRRSPLTRAQKKKGYKAIGSNALVRKLLREVKIEMRFKRKLFFILLKHRMYGLLSHLYK